MSGSDDHYCRAVSWRASVRGTQTPLVVRDTVLASNRIKISEVSVLSARMRRALQTR